MDLELGSYLTYTSLAIVYKTDLAPLIDVLFL